MKIPASLKPDLVDVLALAGLVLVVAGVWTLFSVGHAMLTAGALLLVVAGALYSKTRPWAS